MNSRIIRFTAVLFALAVLSTPAQARSPQQGEDLTELDLEQLMDLEVEVTSATRRAQPLADVPGAIFVLTNEDLRRSGADSLPEALRLVPGMQVARLDANRWAVTARGFNDQFSNKLLILIDGRTVYTPLFSGVFWEALDVPIDDIERIEVIRGPGAVMWGSNAVNGVISVITRSAHDTKGGFARLEGGTEQLAGGTLRYGAEIAPGADWRVWARGFERASSELDGAAGVDDWNQTRAGFRVDWRAGEHDAFTFQGDTHRTRFGTAFIDMLATAPYAVVDDITTNVDGAYALGRWTRSGDSAQSTVQVYVDESKRMFPQFGEERHTVDLDFQRSFAPAARHALVWGFGARHSDGAITRESFRLSFADDHRSESLLSAFVQDEYELVPNALALTVGAKLEHDNFTALEFQPNMRLMWKASEHQRLWASAARAVRRPSWAERDVRVTQSVIPGALDTYVVLTGNDEVSVETLYAFELGYRAEIDDRTSFDATAFYFAYDNLVVNVLGTPFLQGANVVQPVNFENAGDATSNGLELFIERRVDDATTVAGSLSLLDLDDSGRVARSGAPEAQGFLSGTHAWSQEWTTSAWLGWVAGLGNGDVPAYTRLDLRTEWRPTSDVRVWCGVQGLFHDDQREFADTLFVATREVRTAVFAGMSWGH